MTVNYDKVADAIYIQMKKGKVSSTIEVSDLILHDLDKKGNVLGIELLNASSQFSHKEIEDGILNGIPLNIVSSTPKIFNK